MRCSSSCISCSICCRRPNAARADSCTVDPGLKWTCWSNRPNFTPRARTTSPRSAVSSPLTSRKIVLLPAPLRPTSPTCSPGLTCNVVPRNTSCVPYDLCTSERRNNMEVVCVSALRQRRHEGDDDSNYLVAAGDAAGFTVTGALVVDAGVEVDCSAGLAAGLLAGVAPEPAGRKPRLLGLFNMLVARLLTILASLSAVSNSAAFRICLR